MSLKTFFTILCEVNEMNCHAALLIGFLIKRLKVKSEKHKMSSIVIWDLDHLGMKLL